MKVTAILKGLIDSNGHQPIQIRIHKEGKRSFRPTSLKIEPKLFKKGKVLTTHPKAGEWNKRIQNLIIQYQAEALEGLKPRNQKISFFEYVEKSLGQLHYSNGSLKQKRSQINKLKEFQGELSFSDITPDFVYKYLTYLRGKGNSENTVSNSIKFIRKFIHKAKDERLISEDPIPTIKQKKYINPERTYLIDSELKALEKFKKSRITEDLKTAVTYFLIACETGMRVSDLIAFSRKNIHANRIVFQTVKTKDMVGIPIMPKLRNLLEEVNYKGLPFGEEKYNKLLKLVALGAGISKKVTSHVARHTAAMRLANAGVSIEVAAAILGHKSIKNTAIYYKVSNKRIDDEMKKLK